MKRYHSIAVLGVVLVAIGLVVLWTPVLAQDEMTASNPAPPKFWWVITMLGSIQAMQT